MRLDLLIYDECNPFYLVAVKNRRFDSQATLIRNISEKLDNLIEQNSSIFESFLDSRAFNRLFGNINYYHLQLLPLE